MKLLNIGFGNLVQADKIIAIVSPDSAPVKRIIQESKDRSMCIDATYGRRTRSVIIMDSDHVVLSAIQPETVAGRADVTEEELLAKVQELNEDSDVDGFIVQLPLPKHIAEQKVIEAIDYRKDVDGFHPINVGRMSIG